MGWRFDDRSGRRISKRIAPLPAVLLSLFFCLNPARAETPWLRGFPTVAQVKRDIETRSKGDEPLKIEAHQAGRFFQLIRVIEGLNGGPGRALAPDAENLRRRYQAAASALQRKLPPGNCPTFGRCDRRLFFEWSGEYQYNPTPAKEAAALYFSPDVKARYLGLAGLRSRDISAEESAAATNRSASVVQSGMNVGFFNSLWLFGSVILGLWWLWILLFVIWRLVGRKARQKAAYLKALEKSLDELIGHYGKGRDERSAAINRAFDEKRGDVDFSVDVAQFGMRIKSCMGRNLAAMSGRERESLRASMVLYNEKLNVSTYNSFIQICGLVYGEGKAVTFGQTLVRGFSDQNDLARAVKWLTDNSSAESCVNLSLRDLNKAVEKHPGNPLIKELASRLLGDGNDLVDKGALTSASLSALPENFLILGDDAKGADALLGFSGEGSLITVAPPGSGKTQCHVIPNLLTWRGPAVVLDIKGEIFETTSGWRAANVGPIYKFSPLSPDTSHCYNPLSAVSSDPDHIWEDSRFLADMLIVPTGAAKDPFWESRARDVVTAATAYIVRSKPPEERHVGSILDILHGVGWDRFIMALSAATDVPTMVRTGASLGEMETKLRDSVLQTALASLSSWEGARIARATARSDWRPQDLRDGRNATVYICINPNEIDSYASMLRVVIAQHIRSLTARLPGQQAKPILFVLDELPRLRRMPPVEEALEIGRQYGIKLWMFTQSLGQLKTAYENADGMVGSCAVRMFMNPSLQDGTAQKLSDDMGFRDSVIDGSRVKRVEPNVLAGPEFKDKIIVMAANANPSTVNKHFAYADRELASRMTISPPAITKPRAVDA